MQDLKPMFQVVCKKNISGFIVKNKYDCLGENSNSYCLILGTITDWFDKAYFTKLEEHKISFEEAHSLKNEPKIILDLKSNQEIKKELKHKKFDYDDEINNLLDFVNLNNKVVVSITSKYNRAGLDYFHLFYYDN